MDSTLVLIICVIVAIILGLFLWCCRLFSCCYRSDGIPIDDRLPDEELKFVVVEPKSEKKLIERQIFEKSFELIGRSNGGHSGLRNKYVNAYNTSTEGRIDWHRVFPNLKSRGDGYIAAISYVSNLLPKSDSKEKREIYSLVDRLIKLRFEENQKFKDNPLHSQSYAGHHVTIEAWQKFKK